jgi:hypothetical protein
MYKVSYYTLGINSKGEIGNIKQFNDVLYTDSKIENIQNHLDNELQSRVKRYKGVITKIENIKGHVIKVSNA